MNRILFTRNSHAEFEEILRQAQGEKLHIARVHTQRTAKIILFHCRAGSIMSIYHTYIKLLHGEVGYFHVLKMSLYYNIYLYRLGQSTVGESIPVVMCGCMITGIKCKV